MKNKEWKALCMAILLCQQCKNRDDSGNDTGNSSNDTAPMCDKLTAVLAAKPAMFYQHLSPIGYLMTIVKLFKIAFLSKKRDGTHQVFYGFVEQMTVGDVTTGTTAKEP